MRKALISTLSCLCIGLLLLAGTIPTAFGQSAIDNDAQTNKNTDVQTPDTQNQLTLGDAILAGGIAGCYVGLLTAGVAQVEMYNLKISEYARNSGVEVNELTFEDHTLLDLMADNAIGNQWAYIGMTTGFVIGLLVTGALLIIFFSGYVY